MAATPGILYVTMERGANLSPARFQDWYNNEHGPLRLRLTDFVTNGFRYRASDLEDTGKGKPEWMAIYDITDMAELTKDQYMQLRGDPIQSQRERDLRPDLTIDRRSLDLANTWDSKEFKPLEALDTKLEENSMVAVSITLKKGSNPEELNKWYEAEHISSLSKMSGWLRSRSFTTSAMDGKDVVEYLTLHDYAPKNGLDGREIESAVTKSCPKELVEEVRIRTYNMHYIFGPAPRELAPLSEPDVPSFDSPATETRTFPDTEGGAIESYITTKDGVRIRYRLEGSSDMNAPLIVLSNSILVDWGIWDGFVSQFLSSPQNKKYRILRYLTRGRSSDCGSEKITVQLLASDIIALLDALRVPQAAAIVGVSLGGATVLCAGLTYPERIAKFMSCDTSSKSPQGNSKLWGERIALAEKEGAINAAGERVVGDELAEITVRRWFVAESYDGGNMEKECERVKSMVVNNSLEGFKKTVEALFEYDLKPQMAGYQGKAGFLVGGGDGKLPETMDAMAKSLGQGAAFHRVEGAGHLPMVEKPKEVVEAVVSLLAL